MTNDPQPRDPSRPDATADPSPPLADDRPGVDQPFDAAPDNTAEPVADDPAAEPVADDTGTGPVAGVPPSFGAPPPDAGAPPMPPYGVPAPPPRRLVRDPYSRLGGVASGIAHYYGLDVSLVRVVTLLLALTTGIGLLAYLLAWLIIPRADYWPPAPPAGGGLRSVSNRDIGIGLAAVGILAALAIGGGAGGFLVPLVLVGGGVWLLLQPPAPAAAPASPAAGGTMAFAAPGAPPAPPAGGWPGPGPAYLPPPAGGPVPRRSRRRRFALVALIGTAALALLAIPLLIIAGLLVAVARNGDIDLNAETETITPATLADLPQSIDQDSGELIIDLTNLDLAEFDRRTTPAELDVRIDAGRIEVIVPDDVDLSIDADVGLGNIEVFNRTEDGIRPDVTITATDPDLDLTLDVGAGEIVVRRS